MTSLNMFLPITKVEAAQRLVYGVVTAEREDRAGEICDYDSTKPLYQKWSRDMEKASDGKSLGNLRAMHGRIAAGKITELAFDDEAKQIEICAKVVDEAEWQKVCEGVYTGFSQGGTYVERWRDKAGRQRYTAEPREVSLVDLPCLPSATFQLIKADGQTEVLPFRRGGECGEEWEKIWRSRRDGLTFKTKADLRKHHEDMDARGGAGSLAKIGDPLAKIGARNNKEDQERIQTMHDHAVALGAACASGDAAPAAKSHASGGHAEDFAALGEKLEKLFAERTAFEKALQVIAPVLDEILQRVNSIERDPRPAPISAATRVVSKSVDLADFAARNPSVAAALTTADREAMSLDAIKEAHKHPQKMGLKI